MKHLTINAQTISDQSAYGLINQINNNEFKHFKSASKLVGTGRLSITLVYVTKNKAIDHAIQLRKLYPAIVEVNLITYDQKSKENVRFLKLPVTNVLETEDLIKEFKLKHTLKELQEA